MGGSCGNHKLECSGLLKTKRMTAEAPELRSEDLCMPCFAFVTCVHAWRGLLASAVAAPCRPLARQLLSHGGGLFQ